MSITTEQVAVLNSTQTAIGAGNAAKGFHEEGDNLREWSRAFPSAIEAARSLRTYYGEKLLLIVSEVTEAHDELRAGHAVDETYYPEKDDGWPNAILKPEGVPSELADVVIRCFDFADEAGIDLGAMIAEKVTYNATRPFKHGKKF